jgi:cytochrome c oxidase cbb3-type subunit 3
MTMAWKRALPILCVLVAAVLFAAWRMIEANRLEARMMRSDPQAILADPALAGFAVERGRSGFAAHCSRCHGDGRADPARGIPSLRDRTWLYGTGTVAEVEGVILHGIRSGNARGWALADMPAYARQRPYGREAIEPLDPRGLADVTEFVRSLGGHRVDPAAALRGKALFEGKGACWDCHGPDARGDAAIGAPDLTDAEWLHGDGSAPSIARSIALGRAGKSPAFGRLIAPARARAIAVYVVSLSHPSPKDITDAR